MKKLIALALIAILGVSAFAKTTNDLHQIKRVYGDKAVKRIVMFNQMIERTKNKPLLKKLDIVNKFVNKVKYKDDISHWGKDYAADPVEFLGTGLGDSEDYAIAKRFALLQLGIPANNIKFCNRGQETLLAYVIKNKTVVMDHKVNKLAIDSCN